MIAKFCLGLFVSAKYLRVPKAFDRVAARIGCGCIRIYQRWLSRRAGRLCLFQKNCSEFAITSLREFGWAKGTTVGVERLRRCGGAFSLSVDVRGRVAMVTNDGTVFGHDELANWMRGTVKTA